MPRPLLLLLAALLLPAAGQAAPKKAKELLLQPLVEEMKAPEVELTKAQAVAVKRSESCLQQDSNWLRAQQNQVPVSQLYELLGSAVVCWQGAEKKAAAAGAEGLALHGWTAGRTRYMESFRSWMWAVDAKMSNDRRHICQRLETASKEALASVQAADGLAERYQGAGAKAMAFQLEADSKVMAETVSTEYKNQRCSK